MTSIEWLWEEIDNLIPYEGIAVSQIFNELLVKAKEMHKQEITNSYRVGAAEVHKITEYKADKYYQETFVSKGSYINGDIVTKDSVIDELPTTTSDLIDSAIWSLPFDDRMKVWDLIEKLVEEEKETLYTEEQVRKAIEDARDILSHVNTDEVIKSLKQPKKD